MRIPGLARIKSWALAILGGVGLFLYAILKGREAADLKRELSREEAASQTEKKALQAQIDGGEREAEIREKHRTNTDRYNIK